MKREPDQDGRYPLSMREYETIRMIFAAVTALNCEPVRERCEQLPGTYETLMESRDALYGALSKILSTVPVKKLVAMKHELEYTACKVELKPPSRDAGKDYIYIPRRQYIALLQRAIQMDCMVCEKTVKECRRCDLYRDIDACFPYLLEEPDDQYCPFHGVTRLEVEPNARR